jgi:hypothetical protein
MGDSTETKKLFVPQPHNLISRNLQRIAVSYGIWMDLLHRATDVGTEHT